MSFFASTMKAFYHATNDYLRQQQIEAAGETIQKCSITAAVSSAGASFLPGIGGIISAGITIVAIWTMYVKINKDLEISISKNILKSLASALLTNIIGSVASLFLSFICVKLLNFMPGLHIPAAMLDGAIAYVIVFASAVLYIKLLTKLFCARKSFDLSKDDIPNITEEIIRETSMKDLIKEAKESYNEHKEEIRNKKNY